MIPTLDLFSGIGGFSLGLEATGYFETIAFCEFNHAMQKRLRRHWPEVPMANDIRKLWYNPTSQRLMYEKKCIYRGAIRLICGGFPCQPFSNAGKRGGTTDERHLWPEMFRLIKEIRPTWVIGENVAGITSMELPNPNINVESKSITRTDCYDDFYAIHTRKADLLLNQICEDLEQNEYQVTPLVIPACAVDAKHRRDRLWLLCHTHDNGQPTTQERSRINERGTNSTQKQKQAQLSARPSGITTPMADPNCSTSETRNKQARRQERGHINRQGKESASMADSNANQCKTGCKQQKQCRKPPTTNACSDVPNTKSERIQRHRTSRQRKSLAHAWEKVSVRVSERPEPAQWIPEPRVGRVVTGLPDRVDRIKGLGNAVVPQIPFELGMAIVAVEKQLCKN